MLRRCTAAVLVWPALWAAGAEGIELYVSPAGRDTNPGTLQAPLATVHQALAVRRKAGVDQPAVIRVRGGTYYLAEPLSLTPEDSGRPESPLVIEAHPGETPVLSAGVRLSGWRVDRGRWTLELPEVKAGRWRFSQLFVNGQRRYRSRLPKQGYYYIRGHASSTGEPGQQGHNRFRFSPRQLRRDWRNLHDVEVLVFHNWSMSRIPLAEIDEDRNIATLAGRTWHSRIAALAARKRFLVENVAEALSEPGEWYLDRATGVITYLPLAGEDPETAVVVAPRLDEIVTLRGESAVGCYVEHVTLRGLTFAHANWNVPAAGYCCAQAEVSTRSPGLDSRFGGAINAAAARHCTIERCTVAHVGFYAVEFGAGCHSNRVLDCELWDTGAGGVMLGTTRSYPTGDPRIAAGQIVQDCLIAHGGRMHPAAVGVWIGHSAGNRVVHNDIHDFYYTGVSVGWRWGYGWSPAKGNVVSHNHIHHIGQSRLSDLGGIYTLGESQGTVLSFNRIHDVSRVRYGGSGIYFDQATTGLLVENNLVFRTQDAGFTVHWGRDNMVRNNIFAYGREIQIGLGRPDKSGALTFERNIVLWREGTATNRRKPREDFAFDRNLYWSETGEPAGFAQDLTFPQWQAAGKDRDSLVADPRFADPAKDDFRLPNDSPARAIGFLPFDLTDVGRRTSLRSSSAAPVPHAYPEAGPPPPVEINESFEYLTVGDKIPDAHTYENTERETARCTDEQAATGKRSLKLTDGPGPGPGYNPHFHYMPGFRSGIIKGAFHLWLGPGSALSHGWRDAVGRYRTGPSMRVAPDGTLSASGKALTKLPHSRWVRIEIVSGLGEQTTGRYDLTVTVLGQAAQRFEGLPHDPLCRSLKWLGWVAGGTVPSVMYLDDITLSRQR